MEKQRINGGYSIVMLACRRVHQLENVQLLHNYTRLHEKKEHVCQTCRLSVNFRMPKRNQYSSTIDSIDHSAEQTTKRGLLLDWTPTFSLATVWRFPKWEYPQFSSIYRWDFPWNKPSSDKGDSLIYGNPHIAKHGAVLNPGYDE